MDAVSTTCPGCGSPLKLPPGAVAGRQIRCPGCKTVFTVPAPDRADAETQRLDKPADKAAARTQQLGKDADPWADDRVAAAPARPRVRAEVDEEDEAVRSYGMAKGDGEDAPLIGKVGRFELRRFLGQGAFGKVYLAHDPQLDRAVALKVPRHPPTDEKGVRQFMQEATSAARLKHPNIVTIHEAGRAGDTLFIVSEFVEGVPLSVRLAERPPKPRLAARWVRDLARALQYAHDLGVVHRDIKPANVMVGREDRVQLMDFGLALRRDADGASVAPGIVGTPAYMAPEQARGESAEIGPKSDQFALGVVLYELLTGVTPFRGPLPELLRQITDPAFRPPPPRKLKADIPADLSAVCMKALAKKVGNRYRSAADLAADLQRWLDGKKVLAGKPPPGSGEARGAKRSAGWVRKHPRLTAGIALAVLLVVGAVVAGLWVRGQVREADRKLEEARRTDLARDADLFREKGARLAAQGKPAEGLALLARSFEIAAELNDAERQRSAEAALAEGGWELPAPPGLDEDAAKGWRLAGGLLLGLPVADVGEGRRLPHAGRAAFTGYVGGKVATGEGAKSGDDVTTPTQLRDAATGQPFANLPAAAHLVFAPDGRRVFYASGLTWGLWDAEDRALLGVKHDWDQRDRTGAFTANGARVLAFGTGQKADTVEVWDTASAKRLFQVFALGGGSDHKFVGGALGPDGKVAVLVARGDLRFWPVGSRDREMKPEYVKSAFKTDGGEFRTAAFAPDGSFVAVAREKATDRWTPAGERTGVWLPAAEVRQIVFSPDGRFVVLLEWDGARVWDAASGKSVGPARHKGAARVQFRPDGRQFLTAGDGDIRLWPHPVVPPNERAVAVRLWAEATTGLEVTADGQLRPIPDADRAERRAKFEQLAGLAP